MTHNTAFFVVGLMALSTLTRMECLALNPELGSIQQQQDLSPGYQCKALGYAGNCRTYPGVSTSGICAHLLCADFFDGQYRPVYTRQAVVNTPCGNNQVCDRDGHCVGVRPYDFPFIGIFDEFECTGPVSFAHQNTHRHGGPTE